MQDEQYRRITFRGVDHYLDTKSFSPVPVEFVTGRVIDKGSEWIRQAKQEDLAVLDFCSGVGVVGLSLALLHPDRIARVGYVDINFFNLLALRKGLAELNGLDEEQRRKHVAWLSEGLTNVPATEQFDLILCNPPHRDLKDGHEKTTDYSMQNVFLVDPGWKLHRDFYAAAHTWLKPGGECWFIEVVGSPRNLFVEMIRANSNLALLGQEDLPPHGDEPQRYYWMGCRRK